MKKIILYFQGLMALCYANTVSNSESIDAEVAKRWNNAVNYATPEAVEFILRQADEGNELAQGCAVLIYYEGLGGTSENKRKGLHFATRCLPNLKKRADQGDTRAAGYIQTLCYSREASPLYSMLAIQPDEARANALQSRIAGGVLAIFANPIPPPPVSTRSADEGQIPRAIHLVWQNTAQEYLSYYLRALAQRRGTYGSPISRLFSSSLGLAAETPLLSLTQQCNPRSFIPAPNQEPFQLTGGVLLQVDPITEMPLWRYIIRDAMYQDHPDAQFLLSRMYEHGNNGVEQDDQKALFWCRQAVSMGQPDAWTVLKTKWIALDSQHVSRTYARQLSLATGGITSEFDLESYGALDTDTP